MPDPFKIHVVCVETGETVKTLGAATERSADRIERGLNINLNHTDYYTRVERPEQKEQSNG